MSKYNFKSKKIIINEADTAHNVEIKEKGTLKVITTDTKAKKLRGTGIYDRRMFKEARKSRLAGKILQNPEESVNFYMKLNAPSPSIIANYSIFGPYRVDVEKLLTYKSVLLDGKVVPFASLENLAEIKDDDFMFGQEAVLTYLEKAIKKKKMSDDEKESLMAVYDEWLKVNNTRYFMISDLSLREPKLLNNGKKLIIGEVNQLYEDLFDANENNTIFLKDDIAKYDVPIQIQTFEDEDDEFEEEFGDNIEDEEVPALKPYPKIVKFLSAKRIYDAKAAIENSMFSYMSTGKKSVVKTEGISEKLAGAVRGTIVPNPFISEDTIEVGTAFADALYPEFVGLWNDANELNWLIDRGVIPLDKELFRYDADWISEEEKLFNQKENPKRYDFMNYFYPWYEDRYDFIPKDKIGEIKKTINERRMEYYRNHSSDIEYLVLVNRPPTICQLSMLAMHPIFRDSIGVNGLTNENGKKLVNISAKFSRANIYNSIEDADEDTDDIPVDPIELPDDSADFEDDDEVNPTVGILDEPLETVYLEDVLAVNPLTCDGMNSDFDGDLLLVVALYSVAANVCAQALKSSKNYDTVADGDLRNSIPKEFMTAMKNIYKNAPELAEKIHAIIESNN